VSLTATQSALGRRCRPFTISTTVPSVMKSCPTKLQIIDLQSRRVAGLAPILRNHSRA